MAAVLSLTVISCSSRETSTPPPAEHGPGGSFGATGSSVVIPVVDGAPDAIRIDAVGMIEVRAGAVWGRDSTCGGGSRPAIQYVRQEVPGFRIDYSTVTCEQWANCVAAGACPVGPSRVSCKYNHAVPTRTDAEMFCRWRNASLPSWAQWIRAVRGDTRDYFPTGSAWDPARACRRPSVPDGPLRRCEYESDLGVLFAMENPNEAEWTRDVECFHGESRSLAVDVVGNDLGLPSLGQKRAEFRCVADQQPAR